MNKLAIGFFSLLFFIAACTQKEKTQIVQDTTIPSLTYPLSSFSSTDRFYAFGDTLPNLSTNKGYNIFLTDTNQLIAAVCGGIVSSINADAATNNTITVLYKPNSIYTMLYAGIKNVRVEIGDTIVAGSLLGKLGTNREIYFAIIKNNEEVVCPNTYASAAFKNSINTAIAAHNANNSNDSVFTSCLVETLPK